jgi:hypothetical protein
MSLVTDSETEEESSFEGVLDVLYGVTVTSKVRESEIVDDRNACVTLSDKVCVDDNVGVNHESDFCCVSLQDAEGVCPERVTVASAVAVFVAVVVGDGVKEKLSVPMLLECACDMEKVAVPLVKLAEIVREAVLVPREILVEMEADSSVDTDAEKVGVLGVGVGL